MPDLPPGRRCARCPRERVRRSGCHAAGAEVAEVKHFPDRSPILGAPAKVVRELTDDEVARLEASAATNVDHGRRWRETLVRVA